MKTELWKKRQAWSGFRPDPQQLSATCQMFRCDANVRENKSVSGSRSLPGRHTALAAQRRARRDRAAGRPRPLPPARHCSPGKPRPHTGHLLFLQQGAFGGKYVPAGLGHFPPRGPWPRLWPGSCSRRAAMVRASAWARRGLAVASGWISEGGFGKAALQWLHRHQVQPAPSSLRGSWGQRGGTDRRHFGSHSTWEGRMRRVWLPAARDMLGRGCSGLGIGPSAAALSSAVLATGAAQLCALDGPKRCHICHQSSHS